MEHQWLIAAQRDLGFFRLGRERRDTQARRKLKLAQRSSQGVVLFDQKYFGAGPRKSCRRDETVRLPALAVTTTVPMIPRVRRRGIAPVSSSP